MTREEADKLADALINERNMIEKSIREKAEKEGRLLPGLDSNKELTADLDKEYFKKLQDLAAQIDEQSPKQGSFILEIRMQKDTGNSGIGFFGVLAILFITLKLLNIISWSWLWVLAPIWLPIIVVTGLLGIVWLTIHIKDRCS